MEWKLSERHAACRHSDTLPKRLNAEQTFPVAQATKVVRIGELHVELLHSPSLLIVDQLFDAGLSA